MREQRILIHLGKDYGRDKQAALEPQRRGAYTSLGIGESFREFDLETRAEFNEAKKSEKGYRKV